MDFYELEKNIPSKKIGKVVFYFVYLLTKIIEVKLHNSKSYSAFTIYTLKPLGILNEATITLSYFAGLYWWLCESSATCRCL